MACGSYEELLARDDVDAVYILLANGHSPMGAGRRRGRQACPVRKALWRRCRRCPGPRVDACRRNNVHLADGVMFMHSRRLGLLRQLLDDPRWAAVRRITSQFSFLCPTIS